MAYDQHKNAAQSIIARCAVVTLSDTRTEQTDTSGQRIGALLEEAGHSIALHTLIPDDPDRLRTLLHDLLANAEVDVILTNGGTGISPRDNTIAVVESTITLPLPGFGELFRMLSYEQIGSGAILSRACAGVGPAAGNPAAGSPAAGSPAPGRPKILFALPGSTKAVELAMTKLILPELKHLLHELRR